MNVNRMIDEFENIQTINKENKFNIKMIYHHRYIGQFENDTNEYIPMTWNQLMAKINNGIKSMTFGGYDDWRLPNTDELKWILDNYSNNRIVTFWAKDRFDTKHAYAVSSGWGKFSSPGKGYFHFPVLFVR